MNIRLRLHSAGLLIDSVLRPDALPALIELVQSHRVPEAELSEEERQPWRSQRPGPGGPCGPGGPGNRPDGPRHGRHSGDNMAAAPVWDASTQPVRDRLFGVGLEEVFSMTTPKTFPEKILVLGAWLAVCREKPVMRPGDIRRLLARLQQAPPANPGRDVLQTVEFGWLVSQGIKEYSVTDAGWRKLGEMLDTGAGGAAVPA